jgi:hypothetical protein
MGLSAMMTTRAAGWRAPTFICVSVLALAILGSAVGTTEGQELSSCSPEMVGIDTSRAVSYVGAFFGRSVAQVFYAPDTLIETITVWRPTETNSNDSGMHLFITEVDSLNRPDTFRILLDGPTISLPGPASERPVVYAFDPPVALPRTGNFAFAIKDESPDCFGIFSLLADSTMSYPYGAAWSVHPFVTCLGLGWLSYALNSDVIFQVGLCRGAVSVRRQTWGAVRASYR